MDYIKAISILSPIFILIWISISLIKSSVKKSGCQQPNVDNTTKPPKGETASVCLKCNGTGWNNSLGFFTPERICFTCGGKG